MVPAGWLLPLVTLSIYAFIGVVVGLTVAVIAALFGGNVRPLSVAVDVVVGAIGGLVGAMMVGQAYADVMYMNGHPVQGGWQAVVVEHEYLAPAALVAVLVTVVHLLWAMRRRICTRRFSGRAPLAF